MKNAGAKYTLLPFAAVLALALPGCATVAYRPVGNAVVPEPARSVDIERYLGRWFEIYRYEAPFQKDCDAVIADYALNENGTINVQNSCRKGGVNGPLSTASGTAKVVDSITNAKLRVTFFWPFYGDYWVIDHDPEYQWSIVGEPSGTYLWVLSREATPDQASRDQLRQRVEELGYDWSMIRETSHPQ